MLRDGNDAPEGRPLVERSFGVAQFRHVEARSGARGEEQQCLDALIRAPIDDARKNRKGEMPERKKKVEAV